MADEGADDIMAGDGTADTSSKKGGKGIFPQLLKFILIGLAAVILIVTIVVVTTSIMMKNSGRKSQSQIPISEEYTVKRESYDWYTSLDQIRASTADGQATVSVTIVLGYKKDDKQASTEITERRIEIIDFLRRFFSDQTVEELSSKNEERLKQNIRDHINDNILTKSKIRDVKFTAKDIIQQ